MGEEKPRESGFGRFWKGYFYLFSWPFRRFPALTFYLALIGVGLIACALVDRVPRASSALLKWGSWRQWVLPLLAVGFVTMALIQVIKDLTPMRRFFQKNWFGKWLRNRMRTLPKSETGERKMNESIFIGTYRQVVSLAMSGSAKALFDLPLEQFTGQLSTALQTALDYPRKYHGLLEVFALEADQDDVHALAAWKPGDSSNSKEGDFLDARNRVANQVQRTIDTLQVSIKISWKRFLQILAFEISAMAMVVWLKAMTVFKGFSLEMWVWVLAAAVMSGFASTLLRDLFALLQKSRE